MININDDYEDYKDESYEDERLKENIKSQDALRVFNEASQRCTTLTPRPDTPNSTTGKHNRHAMRKPFKVCKTVRGQQMLIRHARDRRPSAVSQLLMRRQNETMQGWKCRFKLDNLRLQRETGDAYSVRRSFDKKYNKSDYQVGTIFSAAYHSSDDNWNTVVPLSDGNKVATPCGTVHSKYRKFVAISLHGDQLTAIPIYTHNGRGLEGKAFPDEYVSIRDEADENPAPAESSHGIIRCRRAPGYVKGSFVGGRSVVHLTEQVTHRYNAFAIIEGHIPLEDLKKLIRLCFRRNGTPLLHFNLNNPLPTPRAGEFKVGWGPASAPWTSGGLASDGSLTAPSTPYSSIFLSPRTAVTDFSIVRTPSSVAGVSHVHPRMIAANLKAFRGAEEDQSC